MSSEHPSPEHETPTATAGDTRTGAPAGHGENPLRGSRTSGTWLAVLLLVVVLVLLAVFILQNTQKAQVSFLGWSGQAPLSATLLIAAAGGALIVGAAGALRILQLRRRVKRELKTR
ncbi:MAG: hypothetical protein JWR20_1272 [Marmoricola sp.]|nr:hypothetical protein [Marmoricola sp.]